MAQSELADRLEALLPSLGTLPLSVDWLYTAIRHCQRNMDFELDDEGNEPDRYAGTALANLANALPEIIAALNAAAPEGHELIEQLEESFTADGTYQQFLPAMRAYLAKTRAEQVS